MDSVRSLSHGGSPIATEVVRRAHAAFPRAELIHLYGATEMAPIATALRHEERLIDSDLARSCGRAVAGVDVRVFDQGGNEMPSGEIGEVVVRGPNIMPGYWNKPEPTAAVLREGWYYSEDLGYMDAQGYLFLVDRAKDMIISGGENVYSTEVEEVLYKHPALLEAAVFGIPDEKWGEAVHAVVVPRPGQAVDAATLVAFCRTQIAGYKVPRQIELRDEPLPKSGPGKVLKRELRAPFWAGHTAQIHWERRQPEHPPAAIDSPADLRHRDVNGQTRTPAASGADGTAAMVRVVDDLPWPASAQSHVQGVNDQLRAETPCHGPADHPPAPGVEHNGEEEKSRRRRDAHSIRSLCHRLRSGGCHSRTPPREAALPHLRCDDA